MADVVLGIDPGVYGAVGVLVVAGGGFVSVNVFPTRLFNGMRLVDDGALMHTCALIAAEHTIVAVAIERPVAIARNGHASDSGYAKLVESQNLWMAALKPHTKGVPIGHPVPTKWQASVTAKMGGTTTKARADAFVQKTWPGVLDSFPPGATERSVQTQIRTGVADALCIAEMGRRAYVIGGKAGVLALGKKASMR